MGDTTMPAEQQIRDELIAMLLDEHDVLCRKLANNERQLERLGRPVRNPRIKRAPAMHEKNRAPLTNVV